MAHQTLKSSYSRLADRLNRYPIGLVDNATVREILSLLFDEREAFVAARFPLMEATLEELCENTEIEASELDGILEHADVFLVAASAFHQADVHRPRELLDIVDGRLVEVHQFDELQDTLVYVEQ